MLQANFWQNKLQSNRIVKEKKLFENLIKSYQESSQKLKDLEDLNQLAIEENNQTIQSEVYEPRSLEKLTTFLIPKFCAILTVIRFLDFSSPVLSVDRP